jgi:hypothetical protein|tara:strand:+ start:24547 stop:24879 length:333 start_codon:yes stop_codon:yes gene_type:complete
MAEGQISPWLPEQDMHRLAILGKLIEECNELSARAARCIIHGIDEIDPDTGRTNREELEREIADARACQWQAVDRLGLNSMPSRIYAKDQGFDDWHNLIDAASPSQTQPE